MLQFNDNEVSEHKGSANCENLKVDERPLEKMVSNKIELAACGGKTSIVELRVSSFVPKEDGSPGESSGEQVFNVVLKDLNVVQVHAVKDVKKDTLAALGFSPESIGRMNMLQKTAFGFGTIINQATVDIGSFVPAYGKFSCTVRDTSPHVTFVNVMCYACPEVCYAYLGVINAPVQSELQLYGVNKGFVSVYLVPEGEPLTWLTSGFDGYGFCPTAPSPFITSTGRAVPFRNDFVSDVTVRVIVLWRSATNLAVNLVYREALTTLMEGSPAQYGNRQKLVTVIFPDGEKVVAVYNDDQELVGLADKIAREKLSTYGIEDQFALASIHVVLAPESQVVAENEKKDAAPSNGGKGGSKKPKGGKLNLSDKSEFPDLDARPAIVAESKADKNARQRAKLPSDKIISDYFSGRLSYSKACMLLRVIHKWNCPEKNSPLDNFRQFAGDRVKTLLFSIGFSVDAKQAEPVVAEGQGIFNVDDLIVGGQLEVDVVKPVQDDIIDGDDNSDINLAIRSIVNGLPGFSDNFGNEVPKAWCNAIYAQITPFCMNGDDVGALASICDKLAFLKSVDLDSLQDVAYQLAGAPAISDDARAKVLSHLKANIFGNEQIDTSSEQASVMAYYGGRAEPQVKADDTRDDTDVGHGVSLGKTYHKGLPVATSNEDSRSRKVAAAVYGENNYIGSGYTNGGKPYSRETVLEDSLSNADAVAKVHDIALDYIEEPAATEMLSRLFPDSYISKALSFYNKGGAMKMELIMTIVFLVLFMEGGFNPYGNGQTELLVKSLKVAIADRCVKYIYDAGSAVTVAQARQVINGVVSTYTEPDGWNTVTLRDSLLTRLGAIVPTAFGYIGERLSTVVGGNVAYPNDSLGFGGNGVRYAISPHGDTDKELGWGALANMWDITSANKNWKQMGESLGNRSGPMGLLTISLLSSHKPAYAATYTNVLRRGWGYFMANLAGVIAHYDDVRGRGAVALGLPVAVPIYYPLSVALGAGLLAVNAMGIHSKSYDFYSAAPGGYAGQFAFDPSGPLTAFGGVAFIPVSSGMMHWTGEMWAIYICSFMEYPIARSSMDYNIVNGVRVGSAVLCNHFDGPIDQIVFVAMGNTAINFTLPALPGSGPVNIVAANFLDANPGALVIQAIGGWMMAAAQAVCLGGAVLRGAWIEVLRTCTTMAMFSVEEVTAGFERAVGDAYRVRPSYAHWADDYCDAVCLAGTVGNNASANVFVFDMVNLNGSRCSSKVYFPPIATAVQGYLNYPTCIEVMGRTWEYFKVPGTYKVTSMMPNINVCVEVVANLKIMLMDSALKLLGVPQHFMYGMYINPPNKDLTATSFNMSVGVEQTCNQSVAGSAARRNTFSFGSSVQQIAARGARPAERPYCTKFMRPAVLHMMLKKIGLSEENVVPTDRFFDIGKFVMVRNMTQGAAAIAIPPLSVTCYDAELFKKGMMFCSEITEYANLRFSPLNDGYRLVTHVAGIMEFVSLNAAGQYGRIVDGSSRFGFWLPSHFDISGIEMSAMKQSILMTLVESNVWGAATGFARRRYTGPQTVSASLTDRDTDIIDSFKSFSFAAKSYIDSSNIKDTQMVDQRLLEKTNTVVDSHV